MSKRFLIFFLIILLMVNQSPARSAENSIYLNLNNEQQIYTIEKNIYPENLKPYQLVERLENDSQSGLLKSKQNSLLWLTSIIIPGLGQLLTGNIFRGLTFTATIAGLICLWGISRAVNLTFFLGTIITGQPSAHLFDFVEIFLYIIIGIVHIWNIFDAYSLSKELSEIVIDQ